jgi:hypothetical protein
MSNKLISMLIVRRLIQLLQRDFSLRHAAAELHLNRETVGVYGKRIKESGKPYEELLDMKDQELKELLQYRQDAVEDPRLVDFMVRKEYFLQELTKRGVTRKLLLIEYRRLYPGCYGYTRFCGLLDEQLALKGVSPCTRSTRPEMYYKSILPAINYLIFNRRPERSWNVSYL